MLNINELFAKRIGGKNYLNNTNLYRFAKIKRAKEEAINKGYEVLDFGLKVIDKIADSEVIETLYNEVKKGELDYVYKGSLEFNKACAGYLRVEHAIEVDYKSEIMQCRGIKEALNILPLAFINKDDYIITTTPGYSVMATMGKWLDCNVYEYSINRFNRYLIDFEDIDESILKKCKLLYINYPNNPTGAVANKEFFKEVIKYARKYNFIVVHDASYIDLCFDNKDKVSFLSVEGAREVGVELFSFSKSFNMSGWGIGFIAGNKDIIKACNSIKENLDSKQLLAIQKAGIVALNNYDKITSEMKKIYLRRHELVKKVLNKHGFKTEIPKAGFYQYTSIPKSCNGVVFESAEEFAEWLIDKVQIMVIPYDIEGRYIRLSMAFNAKDEIEEEKIVKELDNRLAKYKFEFR